MSVENETQGDFLVCRVGEVLAAIPLADTAEVMRPLPINAFRGMAAPLLGLALIRGVPTPVIDGRKLLGVDERHPVTRFVTLRAGSRLAALAVDSVAGVRRVALSRASEWTALAERLVGAGAATLTALDQRFLVVMQTGRLAPEEAWASLALASGEPTP